MDINDVMKNAKTMTSHEMENHLDRLVHSNPRFSNLDEKNKKLALGLISDYKKDIASGVAVTSSKIQHDTHPLYEKRASLGLTERDVEDIRDILGAFKS